MIFVSRRWRLFVALVLLAGVGTAVASPVRAEIGQGRRLCFPVDGVDPGALAVVNLTPVGATAVGNGQLVSSDVETPPTASNVNFAPGTIDPNVAIAPVGSDGEVCFHNSPEARVHLVADFLIALAPDTVTSTGAPARLADTRTGLAGDTIAPGERRCFPTGATPGDLAVVNLTPVGATSRGYGALTSSAITTAPTISNVNYTPGTIDPNVAIAPIGPDGQLCYHNSPDTPTHLVADLLATLDADTATTTGPAARIVDTRTGLGGDTIGPGERRCFTTGATPGDLAVVNLTPTRATTRGYGALTSSDVIETPTISNVNYTPGTIDPNVAIAPIGPDGQLCYHNSPDTPIDLVADLLATLDSNTQAPSFTELPTRLVDTRPERRDTINCPTADICYAAGNQFYTSTDFGQTWTLSERWNRQFVDHEFGTLRCGEVDVCWISATKWGRFFTSLVTVDGGRSWRQPVDETVAADVACVGPEVCLTAGYWVSAVSFVSKRQLTITTDGGRTWEYVPIPGAVEGFLGPPTRLTDIYCVSPTECHAISVTGFVGSESVTLLTLTTTDGWDTVDITER